MSRTLPLFDQLSVAFPALDLAEVKQLVGGEVNADYITNACVVRVSRSLNYSNHPIPSGFLGLWTLKGEDGKHYGLRVREFTKYMGSVYGLPALVDHSRRNRARIERTNFLGMRGIIQFDVSGWADATGHFDLWDGLDILYHEYFAKASTVRLWKCDT
jgi:hypothetical protein